MTRASPTRRTPVRASGSSPGAGALRIAQRPGPVRTGVALVVAVAAAGRADAVAVDVDVVEHREPEEVRPDV